MPEINFDKNANIVFEEIKDISPTDYRKLLTNEDVITQIFPTLFPKKRVGNYYILTLNPKINRYIEPYATILKYCVI